MDSKFFDGSEAGKKIDKMVAFWLKEFPITERTIPDWITLTKSLEKTHKLLIQIISKEL